MQKSILLVAVNAKYIHSSPVLPGLMACCGENADISSTEFNVNQPDDYILSEIYNKQPAAVGFSCYIWNILMIERLLPDIRTLLPGAFIILGGPEAAYNGDKFLLNGLCDLIATGEGEANFPRIADVVVRAAQEASGINRDSPGFRRRILQKIVGADIDGVNHLDGGRIIKKPPVPADFANLPFAYDNYETGDNIIYYESSRGCFNNCAYCLAGTGAVYPVRYKPVEKVKYELGVLIKKGVRLVKFTDRTFNADKTHAMEIWRFLSENHGGCAFHFEIGADLLDNDMLALLKDVKKGVFQFEIGIQTTNARTLSLIGRRTDVPRLFENVRVLKKYGNIRLHLDLIAGLPGEDYNSFARSFDDAYALGPDHLQLGFLKLLPGTALHANAAEHGIVYRETAPYEVLYTNALPYGDLLKLKRIEDVFGRLYNARSFTAVLKYTQTRYDSAFRFFGEFTFFYDARGFNTRTPSKLQLFDIVRDFLSSRFPKDAELIQELVKFDVLLMDNIKSAPYWDYDNVNENDREKIRTLLKSVNDAAGRRARAEKFVYNIGDWLTGAGALKKEPHFCLFVYPRTAGEETRFTIYKN